MWSCTDVYRSRLEQDWSPSVWKENYLRDLAGGGPSNGGGDDQEEEGEEGEDKEDSEREDNLRSGNLLHRNLAQGISPSITTSSPTRSKSPAYTPPPRNPELV